MRKLRPGAPNMRSPGKVPLPGRVNDLDREIVSSEDVLSRLNSVKLVSWDCTVMVELSELARERLLVVDGAEVPG